MTDLEIREVDDWLVLFEDGQPVTAPDGTVLGSRNATLMQKILEDARRFGTDPGAYPSLVCLQFSYLAFALEQTREQLAGGILRVVGQLAEARYPGAIDEMHLIAMVSSAQLVLEGAQKRALMAATVAWQQLGSPTSGIRLVDPDGEPPLVAMARGLCERCCTWLGETVGTEAAGEGLATWPGEWRSEELERWAALFPDERSVPLIPIDQSFPGEVGRFMPHLTDDDFCANACCVLGLQAGDAEFLERCAMVHVLDGMRHFAATPEE